MSAQSRIGESLLIEPRLPDFYGEGEDTAFLEGSVIIRFGVAHRDGQELLAMEIQGPSLTREIVLLRFSELGLWIDSRDNPAGRLASQAL
jgi:hypothetical protein